MLKFVLEKYGIATLKQIWKSGKFETDSIRQADLVKAWMSYVAETGRKLREQGDTE